MVVMDGVVSVMGDNECGGDRCVVNAVVIW